jgi:hypothetical protein
LDTVSLTDREYFELPEHQPVNFVV